MGKLIFKDCKWTHPTSIALLIHFFFLSPLSLWPSLFYSHKPFQLVLCLFPDFLSSSFCE